VNTTRYSTLEATAAIIKQKNISEVFVKVIPILTMRCKKTKNITKENECDQGWQQGAQLAETHAACDR